MTFQTSSKNSSKLAPVLRAEMQQALWLMAIFFVAALFVLPISTLLMSQNLMSDPSYELNSYYLMTERAMRNLFLLNYPLMFATFVFAVTIAWNRFGYLHSNSRVDFLHSLPVSRKRLFCAKLLVANIAYLVPYLISWVIAAAIFYLRTAEMDLSAALYHILSNWLFFNLFFAIATMAALTTGTRVTMAIMGFLLLELIQISFFSVITLLESLQTFWFDNWKLHSYTSAITMYMDQRIDPNLWIVSGAAALLILLCSYLYHIRPSEVQGHAVWGKIFAQIIKYLTLFTASLISAMIFREIGRSDSWLFFGAAFAIFFGHLIAEGIYHFSIKNIFANWKGMIALGIVSFTLIACVSMDLFGYDTRYTPPSEVEYYEIYHDTFQDYGKNKYRIQSEEGKQLIDKTIQNGLLYLDISDQDWDYYMESTSFEVRVKPKGRSLYSRRYSSVDIKAYQELSRGLYSLDEFQEQAIKNLEEYFSDVQSLEISSPSYQNSYASRDVRLSDDETIQKIGAALQKDLASDPFAKNGIPQPLSYISIEKTDRDDRSNRYSYHPTAEYRHIPIFSSYTNTVALLKELMLPIDELITVEDIAKIQFNQMEYEQMIEEYREMGMSEEEIQKRFKPSKWVITDKDEIQQILDTFVFDDYNNQLLTLEYNNPAEVYLKNGVQLHMYQVIE